MGLQVVGGCGALPLDWNDTDQLDLRKVGFNRFYHNRMPISINCRELQDVNVERLLFPFRIGKIRHALKNHLVLQ